MSIWSRFVQSLAPVDLDALERLTAIVEAHVRDYPRVGQALKEIRDRQLYRGTHRTFEEFCKERWEMTPQHANRLIAASEVARKLEPTGAIPKTERLARPLTQLAEQDLVPAWQEAQQLAANDPIRPEHINQVVSSRKPKPKKKTQAKPLRMRVPGGLLQLTPGRGFESYEAMLLQAIEQLEQKKKAAA